MKIFKTFNPFPVTVFLGAFLLFQIQPIIGKYFLPWFGGAPSVWLTCLMFFQLLLLGGYTYAHCLQRVHFKRQAVCHVGLVFSALAVGVVLIFIWGSPILPDLSWRPSTTGHPTGNVLKLLFVSIGLSYFILSTSASLLQAWFYRMEPLRSPYVFYVVSNAASLLSLLSYPFLIEPHFTIREQAWMWSGGFLVYVLLCAGCVSRVWKTASLPEPVPLKTAAVSMACPKFMPLLWTLLSFCGVLALMAITNRMTQDIPPVPFLWILPLSIYLLSYMIGFMEKQRGFQDTYIYLLVCAFGLVGYLSGRGLEIEIRHQIAAYSFILLMVCLFCHNALYRTKPDPKHLTGFYLCLSLGGALGGLFVVLAAPFLFKGYWEYQLVLILSGALAVFFIYNDPKTKRTFRPLRHLFPVLLVGFAGFLVSGIVKELRASVYTERNFFGSVQVVLEHNNNIPIYSLFHGKINHGMQIHHPRFIKRPTTYFSENGGCGLAILNHPKYDTREPMNVGLVGMGIGVLSAYGREGDRYRFYEIDPAVIRLAENSVWFSYLKDSAADISIAEGDGRISLESELKKTGSHQYDLLVIDVFSGDHIPVHILTLEAFDLYLKHLAENGVIAVNISNRYLDLLPVLLQIRNRFNLQAARILSEGDNKITANAQWVLFSRDSAFIRKPAIAEADSLYKLKVRDVRPWTDDYSNLLSIMK
ncbi:MAG: fused MFS/spermidine synthase [Pontiellaceae bacterium]|nr:fused MFS/spermidine synthase [Pontiellaceae bacterium]